MTLRDLEAHFVDRHIGPDADEQAAMLDALGLASLDELADRTVPASIRDRDPLDLPPRETRPSSSTSCGPSRTATRCWSPCSAVGTPTRSRRQ